MPNYATKGIRAIAAELGYENGEYMVRNLLENIAQVRRWKANIDRGVVPDELAHLTIDKASRVVREEMRGIIEDELKLMPYLNPKLQAVEAHNTHDAGVGLVDLLRQSAAAKAAEDDGGSSDPD